MNLWRMSASQKQVEEVEIRMKYWNLWKVDDKSGNTKHWGGGDEDGAVDIVSQMEEKCDCKEKPKLMR